MVASLQSFLLALNSIGMTSRAVSANQQSRTCLLLIKAMQHHALRRRKQMARTKRIGGGTVAWARRQMISRKKWALLEGSRKPMSRMERRIKKLQRLLPNGEQSTGLEGLFGEAADYIMCLQLQVKVMQIMVSVLSPTDSGD